MKKEERLWYKKPAAEWNEALPLGNGRLGAMVFGRPGQERIQLNEESIWSGGYRDRNNPEAKTYIPEIRRLIKSGRLDEAEALSRFALSGTPEFQRTYQTLGDLEISFPEIKEENTDDYQRSLCLERAVAETSFTYGGVRHKREAFISAPADALIVRLKSSAPEGMNFSARLLRNRFCEKSGSFSPDSVYVTGSTGDENGIRFCMAMSAVRKGGSLKAIGEFLVFREVKEAVLLITAASNFREDDPEGFCREHLKRLKQKPFSLLLSEHIKDYQAYEKRVSLVLDSDAEAASLPTDERLRRFAEDPSDLGLIALYFRFGRYLLISSSRPGALPANLQGIWCRDFLSPWDSKYTININTEMNYWPAECCNLSDCHEPLFELIKRMYPHGKKTAEIMYGAGGFVAHHNTDIWGDTAPQDSVVTATYWVMGAAWLCLHLWEHYRYTKDKAFLDEHYYLLREATVFFRDYLCENEAGELVVFPTVSPENTYLLPDGSRGRLSEGCSMDSQILYALFTATIKACEILEKDADFAAETKALRAKLPPLKIGRDGCLQEWPEDYAEAEPGHRHISHLFALFPGEQIRPDKTPALAEAAVKTLEKRLQHGGGHTGWSRAWIINFWAHLRRGREAGENINQLLISSTLPNLFDTHPPFQIDGNFGGTAGIANVLMQSSDEAIYLLPALPPGWDKGKIRGLKAKGALTLSVEWEQRKLKALKIRAEQPYEGTVFCGEAERALHLAAGETIYLDESLDPRS